MRVKQMTVTPAQAKKWLEGNTHNRPIHSGHLDYICREMKNGWHPNGDAIRFATDGTLLDGQHRLAACVKTGKSFDTLVITDLPKSAFDTIDTGRARSLSDLLGRDGVAQRHQLAAGTRALWVIQRGKVPKERLSPGKGHQIFGKHKAGLMDACDRTHKWHCHQVIGSGPSIAVYYLAHQLKPRIADTFFRQVGLGAEIVQGSPVHTLREGLLAFTRQRGLKMRIARDYPLCLTVAAWNATAEKRKFTPRMFAKVSPADGLEVRG